MQPWQCWGDSAPVGTSHHARAVVSGTWWGKARCPDSPLLPPARGPAGRRVRLIPCEGTEADQEALKAPLYKMQLKSPGHSVCLCQHWSVSLMFPVGCDTPPVPKPRATASLPPLHLPPNLSTPTSSTELSPLVQGHDSVFLSHLGWFLCLELQCVFLVTIHSSPRGHRLGFLWSPLPQPSLH